MTIVMITGKKKYTPFWATCENGHEEDAIDALATRHVPSYDFIWASFPLRENAPFDAALNQAIDHFQAYFNHYTQTHSKSLYAPNIEAIAQDFQKNPSQAWLKYLQVFADHCANK